MNKQYFGIRGQKTLKLFLAAWKAGQENLANYFTKHRSAKHHKRVHLIYLQTNKTPRSVPILLLNLSLQGCIDPDNLKTE